MPKATGWSVLAEKGLELAALALAVRAMEPAGSGTAPTESAPPPPLEPAHAQPVHAHPAVAPATPAMRFLEESADEGARYFRAGDGDVELIGVFLSDGRIRLADHAQHRFAGMLQNEQADLLNVVNNQWSRVYIRATPQGATQLELYGGPYDARVLTCEDLA